MQFREFRNPEEADYDIKSSLDLNGEFKNDESRTQEDIHRQAILEAMLEAMDWNMLEDLDEISDEELIDEYGITKSEYLNPTKETVLKIKKNKQGKNNQHKSR